MSNPFFTNKGPFNISVLLKLLNTKTKIDKDQEINDIKDLVTAESNCITFFHSKKYQDLAKKTKASYCITTDNFKEYLFCIVENLSTLKSGFKRGVLFFILLYYLNERSYRIFLHIKFYNLIHMYNFVCL